MALHTPLPIAHLLVPLDGSRLAEATLPAATTVAERLGARVTLLHVLERDAPATRHGERHLTDAGEAEAYLNGVASRFADASVPVNGHVHPNREDDVAASIAAHAAEFQADLIVICTHGQGGPREWLSGSLAQQVVRRAAMPLLLVRPDAEGRAPDFAPRAVLVALDGTPESELTLPVALAIAQAWTAPLRLVVIVATLTTVAGDRAAAARLTPAATSAALDLEEATADEYLARLRQYLSATGVMVTTEVKRGDVVREMRELIASGSENLLALATHGHSGLNALWAGSVGSKVVAHSTSPLLLVNPHAGAAR